MPRWTFPLSLPSPATLPLFVRIARALAEEVQRGRLAPGARLPGARTLARTLGVHRNTAAAAYAELAAEGWIEPRARSGTFVAAEIPSPAPRPFARRAPRRSGVPRRALFEVGPAPEPVEVAGPAPGMLDLGAGVPDVRLTPVAALARAYRRALLAGGREALRYADPFGHPRLREALAALLAEARGLAAGPDDVLVTQGSQMALHLAAQTLVRPGDRVAVEAVGYRPAWEALRLAGATLVPVPVDGEGLRVEELEAACARQPLRAVYVTPHHQYPTTVTMTAGRRLALLALARERRVAIVEDDYDHEFHYEGRPVLPLASADEAGVVCYVGTLAKVIAPGVRIGYLVAPPPVLVRAAARRALIDHQGDRALERAVAELLEEGEVQRHARRARRVYRARRDAMVRLLEERFGGAISLRLPAGGLALWVRTHGVDPERWSARALAAGVRFWPGRRYALGGERLSHVRLCYASLDEGELAEAVDRMARAMEPAARPVRRSATAPPAGRPRRTDPERRASAGSGRPGAPGGRRGSVRPDSRT